MKHGNRRNLAIALLGCALLLILAISLHSSAARAASPLDIVRPADSAHRLYRSQFPRSESPISENGNWKVSKGDFADVRTLPGFSFGTQTGTKPAPMKYDDSTAVLTGDWGRNQIVQIVVHYNGARTDRDSDEVEIRLRSAISERSNTGYEINCRVGRPGIWGYIQVGKVNGPLGGFTGPFQEKTGPAYSCHDGDIIVATAIENTLKVYVNGEQVLEARDSTFPTGAPGIGFYHEGTQAQNTDFGISSVVATDDVPTNWTGLPSWESQPQHFIRYFKARLYRRIYHIVH